MIVSASVCAGRRGEENAHPHPQHPLPSRGEQPSPAPRGSGRRGHARVSIPDGHTARRGDGFSSATRSAGSCPCAAPGPRGRRLKLTETCGFEEKF